ncbi:type IV pilus assembly protein PilM [Patescibacteria group bacterium]|nr:type IV pilus assembly protein PilM [Patescibacteria group bacterium]
MGLFSSAQPTGFVGVDIGYGGMKLVELKLEKGRLRLVTYAYINVASESLDQSLLQDTQATGELLRKMVEKARITSKRTVAALPISGTFSSILHVPTTDEKAVKEAVQTQAKKLIPMPLEDVALDTVVIDKTAKTEQDKAATRVLMTAAPKTLVNKYAEICKKAGLELAFLETEAFAEIRSLIGKDRATIMIVDIGTLRTNIMIVEQGVPFVMRSIASGGSAMTQTIAKTLGIPVDQAETMKRDISGLQKFAPTGDVSPVLQVLVKPILDEIRYATSLYESQSNGNEAKRIDKIILTGGASLLPHLPEFLTQQTGVNAYLGNPWARVVYPPELKSVIQELGPRFSVVLGCAMHDSNAT